VLLALQNLVNLRAAPVTGTAATAEAQTSSASGAFTGAGGVDGVLSGSQAQTTAASGSASPASVTGVLASAQAQTTSASGAAAPAAVSGVVSTKQAQTSALAGNASPAAVSGAVATSQGQTTSINGAFASAGVSGVGATSQGQTTSAVGSVSGGAITDTIQPIHGYNFENDRRLLKARREKERLDKLSFVEQLEVIKPQVVKTDKEAARDFVESITSLIPLPAEKKINVKFDSKGSNFTVLQSNGDDDEAIALLIAAML